MSVKSAENVLATSAATTPITKSVKSPTSTLASANKFSVGLKGYLLEGDDDGTAVPLWSKAGTISSLEALRATNTETATI